MLECVLFDLDGLLVDSEPLQFRAYQHAVEQFGIELGMEDWIRWHGAEASTARWVETQRLELDVEQLRSIKKSFYDELIATELELKPGIRSLVEGCAASYRLAVVSASRRESIEACLGKFDLGRHFATLISGSEVARSKPFPDPYIAALRAMQTTPAQAIALEDSLTGYRAATAAGLKCIVCPDHFIAKPEGAFDGAALVTGSLQGMSAERLRAIHAR
jgi:HAD superfamily hydrolase (TIGR01509 family)